MIADFRSFPLVSFMTCYFGKNQVSVQIGHKLYVFPNRVSIPLLSPNFRLFPLALLPKDDDDDHAAR
jgi:hypothetical protein